MKGPFSWILSILRWSVKLFPCRWCAQGSMSSRDTSDTAWAYTLACTDALSLCETQICSRSSSRDAYIRRQLVCSAIFAELVGKDMLHQRMRIGRGIENSKRQHSEDSGICWEAVAFMRIPERNEFYNFSIVYQILQFETVTISSNNFMHFCSN